MERPSIAKGKGRDSLGSSDSHGKEIRGGMELARQRWILKEAIIFIIVVIIVTTIYLVVGLVLST